MELLVELVLALVPVIEWPGEAILFLLTFGRHKPRWGFRVREEDYGFGFSAALAYVLGIAFWVAIFIVAIRLIEG